MKKFNYLLLTCLCLCTCLVNVAAQCGEVNNLKNSIEAQAKLTDKKPGEALKLANKSIETNPTCFYAYFVRGKQLFEAGKFNEAVADFKKIEELIPQETRAAWQSKISEAKNFLEQNSTKAYFQSCQIYGKANKLQLAYNDCMEAAKRSKSKVEEAQLFAYYAEVLNRPDMAAWAYTMIILAEEKKPNVNLSPYYEMLGKYHYLNGKFDLAAEDFKQAAGDSGYDQKFLSLENKAREAAKSGFVRTVNKDLSEAVINADRAKMNVVGAKLDQGKMQEVLSDLNEILSRRPHLTEAVFLRGYAYTKTDFAYNKSNVEADKAIEDFTLAVKLEPWQDVYHYYLAEAYDSIYTRYRSKQKCIESATQAINLKGKYLKDSYAKRAYCESDPVLSHSDYLNSKWQVTDSRDSIFDMAIGTYAANNGCPTMNDGTAVKYFNRGLNNLKTKKDYLCAISDLNLGLSLRTSDKADYYFLRGTSYRGLISEKIKNGIAREYSYPFYLQSSSDFAYAIRDGNLTPARKSMAFHNIGEIFRVIADEFTNDNPGKIQILELTIDHYEKAVPNVDPALRVQVLTGGFFTRLKLAEILMNNISEIKSDRSLDTSIKALTDKLNLVVEKIYAQQKELNQSPDTADVIRLGFTLFAQKLEKFKKI